MKQREFSRHSAKCMDLDGEHLSHQLPYCKYHHNFFLFFRRWISIGFITSQLRTRMAECCSSLVHVLSGEVFFKSVLRMCLDYLPYITTSKAFVTVLTTYRTVMPNVEILLHFQGYHLSLSHIFP